MSAQFSRWFTPQFRLPWLAAAISLILFFGVFVPNEVLRPSPEKVFNQMLTRSLMTRGVTLQTENTQGASSVKQEVQFELDGKNMARSITTLHQGTNTVQSEILATPATDYSRYVAIQTSQKTASGKPMDTSRVLHVWARSGETGQQSGQLFLQAVTGAGLPIGALPVPMADLPAGKRQALLDQISGENVYQIDFSKTQKERVDGRLRYTYNVQIQTVPYVHLLKNFAHDIGITQFDQIDPNNYSSQPLQFSFTVDVASRQLVGAHNQTANYQETFTGYDLPITEAVPASTITLDELRQRFTEMQQ